MTNQANAPEIQIKSINGKVLYESSKPTIKGGE